MKHLRTALGIVAVSILASSSADARRIMIKPQPQPSYHEVVRSVSSMVSDRGAQHLASARGMNFVNVMWEDTGRYQGSSVGPNISDVTIEVEAGKGQRYLMPVMRFPNFSDKTGDVDIDKFFLRVGNEKEGRAMQTISLRQFMARPDRYMSLPDKGRIKGGSLLSKRDDKVLTSAQAAFLPVPRGGKATFHPVIFNYQSYDKNPAVLTLLVTRQGTSMTIIDNQRDTVGGGSWGQRLYLNHHGQRAPLTAERLADVKARGTTSNGESAASLGDDANLLMLIQIPLVVKRRPMMVYDEADMAPAPMATTSVARRTRSGGESDVDVAVLGHGPTQGPYTELDGLTIERDSRFPVRVTVQFYQATSNGVVSAADVSRLSDQIERVYARADYVGSLVVPTRKDLERPTNWHGVSFQPADLSWHDFPGLVERWHRYASMYGTFRRMVW